MIGGLIVAPLVCIPYIILRKYALALLVYLAIILYPLLFVIPLIGGSILAYYNYGAEGFCLFNAIIMLGIMLTILVESMLFFTGDKNYIFFAIFSAVFFVGWIASRK